MRLVLVVLLGAVVWTGRGLFLRAQQGTKAPTKLAVAQVESLLPIQQGWAGHVKHVRCSELTGSAFDYSCTFTDYGTVAKARRNVGGKVFEVGVEDHNGHTVIGQVVLPGTPLGPAPPT